MSEEKEVWLTSVCGVRDWALGRAQGPRKCIILAVCGAVWGSTLAHPLFQSWQFE